MHQAHTLFQTMSINFTVQRELHGSESVRLCQSSQQELFSCTAFASWWVEEETVAGSFLVQELPLQYVSHHVKHKVVYTHIPRGALTLEGGTGMCRPQDPLFQATF